MDSDKTPGEKFSKAVEPFLEEVREMASHAYHKILTIKQEMGQKLQKTIAPRFGIGGTSGPRVVKQQPERPPIDEDKKDD